MSAQPIASPPPKGVISVAPSDHVLLVHSAYKFVASGTKLVYRLLPELTFAVPHSEWLLDNQRGANPLNIAFRLCRTQRFIVHLLGFILKVANHMFSMIIYNNRSEVSFPLENPSNGTWDSTPPKGLGGLPGLCCVFVP